MTGSSSLKDCITTAMEYYNIRVRSFDGYVAFMTTRHIDVKRKYANEMMRDKMDNEERETIKMIYAEYVHFMETKYHSFLWP